MVSSPLEICRCNKKNDLEVNTAVAILNYNGKNWLEKFLPSVIQYSKIADIYVIDNQSTDDSIEFLKAQYPQINIVINSQN